MKLYNSMLPIVDICQQVNTGGTVVTCCSWMMFVGVPGFSSVHHGLCIVMCLQIGFKTPVCGGRQVVLDLCVVSVACRLERPMIANISMAYRPQVHSFRPMITNAGIEFLTVAFPLTKYPGHLQVGLYIQQPVQCSQCASRCSVLFTSCM